MAEAHLAPDCLLGNQVIMANAATLAGHVTVADGANIGAYSGVHQFCRVGREAYIGGYSGGVKNALPLWLTEGEHEKNYGLKKNGARLRRASRATRSRTRHPFFP